MVTFSDALFNGQLHAHFPPFIAERKLGITELFLNIVWEVEDLIERVESGETRTLSLEMMEFLKLGLKTGLGGSEV